jgi:dipeptidyl aminopeptidase/acylaminoacyl peptidase
MRLFFILLSVCALIFGASSRLTAQAMTFEDVMKFKQLRNPVISDGGNWVGYDAWPDRGDGEAIIVNTRDPKKTFRIPLGQRPQFSSDEKYAAVAGKPSLAAEETAKKKKTKVFGDVTLIELATGKTTTFKNGRAFEFSPDGSHFWVHFNTPDSLEKVLKKNTKRSIGSRLQLVSLRTGQQREWPLVSTAAFDSVSAVLAFSVADTNGNNGVRLVFPERFERDSAIYAQKDALIDKLKWHYKSRKLAFVAGAQDKEGKTVSGDVYLWPVAGGSKKIVAADSVRAGWIIPQKAELNWSHSGNLLTFGLRLAPYKTVSYEDSAFTEKAYYDIERILSGVEGDLWHGREPRIKTQEKKVKDRWKTQFFTAAVDISTGKTVSLNDTSVTGLKFGKHAPRSLRFTEMPYALESLWEGSQWNLSLIEHATGKVTPVAEKLRNTGELSPDGRFVLYWKAPHWFLFAVESGTTRNLTENIPVRFDEEDHDAPVEAPPYGFGGWTHPGGRVLLYDRYDIWSVPTGSGAPLNVTRDGRKNRLSFRLVKTDSRFETIAENAPQLLTAVSEKQKSQGLFEVVLSKPGAISRLNEPAKWSFVAKSKKSDEWLLTRQTYSEYPDLRLLDKTFRKQTKLSDFDAQTKAFAWGNAQLMRWKSTDGRDLDGVLILPDSYKPGQKLPVLVYFYEIMSNRLFDFPAVNADTRPDFAQFVSDGYAVFLPDIVYRLDGHPMKSAYDCLIPGVQMLIDLGIADPARIGLHGHSWGGTQTTYLISQTNLFRAAIAGAPITNWVSGYGGIRWESGLARTFQYERTQSRIGASLWEKKDLYLENSALWHADKIKTPLLLQHGDADGAVPWYQSIELYLALRRLGQPVWFLQYFGEDHHLAKYPNKLDYAIKFKEFFDFYLKDAPIPEWMERGIPYRPKE